MRPVLALLVLASCLDHAPPIEPQVTSRVALSYLPLPNASKLDLLFVIDNSPAMAAQRAHLDAKLPELMRVLETLPRGVPDLHLGVITADVGATGTAGCTADGNGGKMYNRGPIAGTFLIDEVQPGGKRGRNFNASLTDAFRAYANVGAQGCSVSRPFEAMQRALLPETNPGFLRSDAYVAVVFVTATDDASPLGVESYVQALKGLFTDPSRVMVSAIAGPRDASGACGATATPRLHALLDSFPNRSTATSICDDDLTGGLALVGQLQRFSLGIQCWEPELLDVEPDVPGTQYACAAHVDYRDGSTEVLAECGVSPVRIPCWRIVEDVACQQSQGSGLTTRIEPSNLAFPVGTAAWIECLVAGATGENP